MSTRACYSFSDEHGKCHVYYHFDGYPANALKLINEAKRYAWELPRFEADEFSAAFVVAAKGNSAGGARLSKGPSNHGDLDYKYDISFDKDLNIKIWSVDFHNSKLLDEGTLKQLWKKYIK